MAYPKNCFIYLFVCYILNLIPFSTLAEAKTVNYTKQAFYMSENNCDKVIDENTGAPILLTAAHLVLIGKPQKVEQSYGAGNRRYSMKIIPQCIMKGDTNEKEIVVRNLGATHCGPSDVELKGDYLFFLRKTSDPKVFETLNLGAKKLTGPFAWTPIFVLFCDITKKVVCEGSKCPMQCNYNKPPPGGCISNVNSVFDTYKALYPPTTPPTGATTTQKPANKNTTPGTKDMTAATPNNDTKPKVVPYDVKKANMSSNSDKPGATAAPKNMNTVKAEGVKKGNDGNGQAIIHASAMLIFTAVLFILSSSQFF